MSLLKTTPHGWLISHSKFLEDIYKDILTENSYFKPSNNIFKINVPYKFPKKKRSKRDNNQVETDQNEYFHKEVNHVEELFRLFREEVSSFIEGEKTGTVQQHNKEALNAAELIYNESEKYLIRDTQGSNFGKSTLQFLNAQKYVFPQYCKFYCRDVSNLSTYLIEDKFDLILLDPPWWNKYIRRKRRFSNSYDMMYNEDLEGIPIGNLLKDDALVVVWCTNSQQHFQTLVDRIFPKWGLNYFGKWYWVKVTELGEPICEFSTPPRKQPFEQIIIGSRGSIETRNNNPPTDKLVVSVPSALHSHKPPLIRILEPYLPENPECLEIFARYLLPNWSSYGNEVLKFQHESFFRN